MSHLKRCRPVVPEPPKPRTHGDFAAGLVAALNIMGVIRDAEVRVFYERIAGKRWPVMPKHKRGKK